MRFARSIIIKNGRQTADRENRAIKHKDRKKNRQTNGEGETQTQTETERDKSGKEAGRQTERDKQTKRFAIGRQKDRRQRFSGASVFRVRLSDTTRKLQTSMTCILKLNK